MKLSRSSTQRRSLAGLGLLLSFSALGCASAVESSKLEDRARRTVPVPICLKPFERHGTAGVVAALNPEDY